MDQKRNDLSYEEREDLAWKGINNQINLKDEGSGPVVLPDGTIYVGHFYGSLLPEVAETLATELQRLAAVAKSINKARAKLDDDMIGGVELREIWLHCDEAPNLFNEAMTSITLMKSDKPTWAFNCNGAWFNIKRDGDVLIYYKVRS